MTKKENVLKAKLRTKAGKGAARAERREGRVPGVIYGGKKAPVMFSVDAVDLANELRKPGFRTRVYELEIEGGDAHSVICHDIQRDLILNRPTHLDFLRVDKNVAIRVEVPFLFVGEDNCVGIKKGGVANINIRELAVMCKPDAIPEHIEVDVSALDIGDAIHLSMLKLPEGVKPEEEGEVTIITIHEPKAEEPEVTPEAEAAAADAAAAAAGDKAAAGASEGAKE